MVPRYYTWCRSAFAPAPGTCVILVQRLRVPYDLGQPEHHQRTASVAHAGVVAERADRAECRGRIFGADAERHAGSGPAADAREDGNVLLAVGPEVRHRVADDPGGRLEPPQLR